MNKFDLTEKAKGYQRSADELAFIMDEMFMSARAFMNMIFEIAAPTDIIIMSGAVVDDGAAPDFTITAGYAFHNGEVFVIDAAAFTAAGGETAVFVLETTDVNLKFQDTATYKAREVRKLKLQSGVSGSGLKDYNQVIRFKDIVKISSSGLALQKDIADSTDYDAVIVGHKTGNRIGTIRYNPGTSDNTAFWEFVAKNGGTGIKVFGNGDISYPGNMVGGTIPASRLTPLLMKIDCSENVAKTITFSVSIRTACKISVCYVSGRDGSTNKLYTEGFIASTSGLSPNKTFYYETVSGQKSEVAVGTIAVNASSSGLNFSVTKSAGSLAGNGAIFIFLQFANDEVSLLSIV